MCREIPRHPDASRKRQTFSEWQNEGWLLKADRWQPTEIWRYQTFWKINDTRIDPVFDKTHSAVFPLELCNRVIRFYSYIGDLVFDPFAGSGTFGKSALNLNRYFFLTEMKSEYIERIKENINQKILSENYKTPTFLDLETFISNTKRKWPLHYRKKSQRILL